MCLHFRAEVVSNVCAQVTVWGMTSKLMFKFMSEDTFIPMLFKRSGPEHISV
jgi:hypothetical protein